MKLFTIKPAAQVNRTDTATSPKINRCARLRPGPAVFRAPPSARTCCGSVEAASHSGNTPNRGPDSTRDQR